MSLRQRAEGGRRVMPSWAGFLAVFLLTASAGSLWALSSPLMSVPDEPAHTVKAVAVWRGQWKGRPIELPPLPGESDRRHTFGVTIPKSYASANGLPSCYAFYPTIAANCAPDLDRSGKLVETTTLAGAYPPLYYVMVGWPSRIFDDAQTGIYLMRIMSALISAALITVGAWCLRKVVSWPLVLLAVTLACTPEVYYLAGSINPNSLEIAAAFALWCSAVTVLSRWKRDGPLERGPIAALVVSAVLMSHTRSLSPLFAVAILVAVAALVGRRQLTELVRDRRAWILAGGLAVAAGSALVWILSSGHLSTVTGGHMFNSDDNVVLMLGSMADDWFAQMIAFFGWTDVGPVLVPVWIWLGAVSVVVSIALLLGRRWKATILGLIVFAVAFGPVIIQYPSAKNGLTIWQGRYFLPIAVGVPVTAAVVLGESEVFRTFARRLLVGMTSLLLVAHLAAHMAAARRFVSSVNSRLNYFDLERWSPPLPPLLLAALTIVVFAGWVVLAALSERAPVVLARDPGEPGSVVDESDEQVVVDLATDAAAHA